MTDPNVEAVRLKLKDRAAKGLTKYGVDTTRTDLTRLEWLQHAQDEALDLAVYLERLISDQRLQEYADRTRATYDSPVRVVERECTTRGIVELECTSTQIVIDQQRAKR